MPQTLVPPPETASTPLNEKSRAAMDRYFRLVNYLAAAQIYLEDNPLLEDTLRPEHIKNRLLGHWGTAPGINLIYLHLNRLILRTRASVLLITGPGHGAAANRANVYVDGTLPEFFPDLSLDRDGLRRFLRGFSWPGAFPSHLDPSLPGVIHEGGELGYALATAFGAALDNPELLVACVVGDGEAETGPTAAAWHAAKFLNPATDGAVLPIVHLNGFKISNPSVLGTMTADEVRAHFEGYGYQVRFVDDLALIHEEMAGALDWAYGVIRGFREAALADKPLERPRWPLIVLKTPKGWTGPTSVDGKRVEGTFRSHQVPVKNAKTNPAHLEILERWLRSYRPEEQFDADGRPAEDIRALCPEGSLRMSMNRHANGGALRRPLDRPDLSRHAIDVTRRGAPPVSSMEILAGYLGELIQRNRAARNFRIVCPDELDSNRLGEVLKVTDRQYGWPVPEGTEHTLRDGRVLEILSEHVCQGWLQGYLLTGRHGLFPCYEAFLPIVDSMMNQYAKFLKASMEVPWRKPISCLNYLLTSETWGQDHNGYSHQGPGFINNLLTKKGHTYRIYLPPDANCLLSTIDHCLAATNYINLVIASKKKMPQWLSPAEAEEHCRVGASVWSWAGTNGGEEPQIVLAGCGATVHLEIMAAAKILREEVPEWRVRVVNVTDLQVLGIPEKYPHGLTEDRFQRIFPLGVPVVFNFHGYTAAIKQLCWERPDNRRFDVNGYREEGTTTTPFDMHVRNRTSRFHIVIQAARKIAAKDPRASAKAEETIRRFERRLREHGPYIRETGTDMPDVANWNWS